MRNIIAGAAAYHRRLHYTDSHSNKLKLRTIHIKSHAVRLKFLVYVAIIVTYGAKMLICNFYENCSTSAFLLPHCKARYYTLLRYYTIQTD